MTSNAEKRCFSVIPALHAIGTSLSALLRQDSPAISGASAPHKSPNQSFSGVFVPWYIFMKEGGKWKMGKEVEQHKT